MKKMDYKIVLASKSPRRKEILEMAGFEFDIWPSTKDEIIISTNPSEVCVELSRQKAIDVASQIKTFNDENTELVTPQNVMVIGSDTIVSIDNEILGKPKDEAQAFEMLNKLSGKTHTVYTGVTLVFMSKDGRVGEYSFFDSTDVTFYHLDEDEINEYIATGSPLDKAGAYGAQDMASRFVKKLDGSFHNVMGFPISRLCYELKNLNVI